jgi:cytochrome bd-type quinol oxidase subunit 2
MSMLRRTGTSPGCGRLGPRFQPAGRVFKIVVILLLVAIVASLGSALFFLVTDKGQSKRTVKALAIRVGLSLTLFLLLMAGYYFGLIPGKIS